MIKSCDKHENSIGAIYEKLTDKNIRKSMGMYYTPNWVIQYILKHTVDEVDVIEKPFLKILDPTCGAGYFLVKVFDTLKEKFLSNLDKLKEKYCNDIYYIENEESKYPRIKKVKGNEYWIEKNIDYHIIRNCLYGMDLDGVAVKLAKRNLLDKSKFILEQHINVIQGDSLIKWEKINSIIEFNLVKKILKESIGVYKDTREDLSETQINRIINNLKKFCNTKYDYIIGNPPYIVMLESEKSKYYWGYILDNYRTIGYKKNVFYLMIERALELLKDGGKNSFIVPDRYFLAKSYEESRKNIIHNSKVINITCFSNNIFKDAIVGTAVYTIEKSNLIEENSIQLKINYLDENNYYRSVVKQKDIREENKYIINIHTQERYQEILNKIGKNSRYLKEMVDVHVGMMIRNKQQHFYNNLIDEKSIKIVVGRDLDEYVIDNENRVFNLNKVEIFGGTKNKNIHSKRPKILMRKTGNRIVAAIDEYGFYAEQSVYLLLPEARCKIYNLLGQLQSNLCNFYFKELLITNPKQYPYIQHYDVERLPVNLDLLKDNEFEEIIKKITDIKYKIKNLKFEIVNESADYTEIMYSYNRYKYTQSNLINMLEEHIRKSNKIVYKFYEVSKDQEEMIEDRIKEEVIKEKNTYKGKVIVSNKYSKIKDSYYYELFTEINSIFRYKIVDILNQNKKYLSDRDIEMALKCSIKNYEAIVEIIKKKVLEEYKIGVINDIIHGYSITWNNYVKSKANKNKDKGLVRYNRNEYGVLEWPEEIHNLWFVDNKKTP